MNKTITFLLGGLIVVILGAWYWSTYLNGDILNSPPVQPLSENSATHIYLDDVIGFSITLPTALSEVVNDVLYFVDTSYAYTAMGPGNSIKGVKFTIPGSVASGTNLSRDSYLSVEHLEKGQACTLSSFMENSRAKAQTIYEGGAIYTFASSSEAAAGNRYEEYLYVLSDSNPCIAVRYFVHFGAIENYDSDTISAFNKAALLADFDSIRKTFIVRQ